MAFIPQLCSAEKKQNLSTYATKAELLNYSTKEVLITRIDNLTDRITGKLRHYSSHSEQNTTDAIKNHTALMERELLIMPKKLMGVILMLKIIGW